MEGDKDKAPGGVSSSAAAAAAAAETLRVPLRKDMYAGPRILRIAILPRHARVVLRGIQLHRPAGGPRGGRRHTFSRGS